MSGSDATTAHYNLRRGTSVGRRLWSLLRSRALARGVLSILGALSFVGVWALLSEFVFQPYLLPSPWAVAERMWALVEAGTAFSSFLATLGKTMLGWGAAFILGVPIGLLMGRYRYARAFFHDLVYLLANVPLIVYAVLSLIIFGVGEIGPAFVVLLLVLPAVAINTAAGVASADEGLLAMSRSFRRSTSQVGRSVILPAVLPFLLAAGRVSFADSWKLAALTETFGGSSGIGYEIQKAFQVFSIVDVLAWMMFFVLFVVAIERVLLLPAERRIFAWRNPGAGLA